ncbi:MAG: hypothetical protein ACYDG4_15105 [Desulfuromonadaceae bacterium]
MPRERGTLMNFVGDGDITMDDVRWVMQTCKMPVGQERTQIIPRAQLATWGILRGDYYVEYLYDWIPNYGVTEEEPAL